MDNREKIYYVLAFSESRTPSVFMYRTLKDAEARYKKEREIGYYRYLEIDVEYVREEGEY